MNREIKFRAWNINEKKFIINEHLMTWYNTDGIMVVSGVSSNGEQDDNENSIIDQYTGIKDKNGIDIYEKDIVFNKSTTTKGEVLSLLGKWTIKWFPENGYVMYDSDLYFCNDIEVIGNIHNTTDILTTEA